MAQAVLTLYKRTGKLKIMFTNTYSTYVYAEGVVNSPNNSSLEKLR
jgi:hypothetical protein